MIVAWFLKQLGKTCIPEFFVFFKYLKCHSASHSNLCYFDSLWKKSPLCVFLRNTLETILLPVQNTVFDFLKSFSCLFCPSILSCTLNSVPENHSLLQKCKLPFGILVHPFKDLSVSIILHLSAGFNLSLDVVRCVISSNG